SIGLGLLGGATSLFPGVPNYPSLDLGDLEALLRANFPDFPQLPFIGLENLSLPAVLAVLGQLFPLPDLTSVPGLPGLPESDLAGLLVRLREQLPDLTAPPAQLNAQLPNPGDLDLTGLLAQLFNLPNPGALGDLTALLAQLNAQ